MQLSGGTHANCSEAGARSKVVCGGSQWRRCGVAAARHVRARDPHAHRKGSGLNPRAGKGSHGRGARRRASARELAKNSHNANNIAVFVVNTLDCS